MAQRREERPMTLSGPRGAARSGVPLAADVGLHRRRRFRRPRDAFQRVARARSDRGVELGFTRWETCQASIPRANGMTEYRDPMEFIDRLDALVVAVRGSLLPSARRRHDRADRRRSAAHPGADAEHRKSRTASEVSQSERRARSEVISPLGNSLLEEQSEPSASRSGEGKRTRNCKPP